MSLGTLAESGNSFWLTCHANCLLCLYSLNGKVLPVPMYIKKIVSWRYGMVYLAVEFLFFFFSSGYFYPFGCILAGYWKSVLEEDVAIWLIFLFFFGRASCCFDMEVVLGRDGGEEGASGCIRLGNGSWRGEVVLRSLVVLFLCRLLKRLFSVVGREGEVSVEGTDVFMFLDDCVEEMFRLSGRIMDCFGCFSVWLDRSVGGIMRQVCDIVDEYEMGSDSYEIEVGVLRAVCSGLYWEFVSCYNYMSCELARDILECLGGYW